MVIFRATAMETKLEGQQKPSIYLTRFFWGRCIHLLCSKTKKIPLENIRTTYEKMKTT